MVSHVIGGPATQLFAVMFGPRGEGQRGQGHHLVEVGVILELDPGATSEVTQRDDGYLGVDRPDLRNEKADYFEMFFPRFRFSKWIGGKQNQK